jgi:hypothetical protein
VLYLIGGVARSGKSSLAEQIRIRRGVAWFPLDALKMGLFLGAPQLGVHPEHDDLETADRMWPIVRGLIENLQFDGRPYVVEGVNLRPETVAEFIAETDEPVAACFLGYPSITVGEKERDVARYTGAPNDWLNRMTPDYQRSYLDRCVRASAALRECCARLGFAFFDTGSGFDDALERAERHLFGG